MPWGGGGVACVPTMLLSVAADAPPSLLLAPAALHACCR
jgi:hypothetical protein